MNRRQLFPAILGSLIAAKAALAQAPPSDIMQHVERLEDLPEFHPDINDEAILGWDDVDWFRFIGGCFVDASDRRTVKAVFGTQQLAAAAARKLESIGVTRTLVSGGIWQVVFDGNELIGKI